MPERDSGHEICPQVQREVIPFASAAANTAAARAVATFTESCSMKIGEGCLGNELQMTQLALCLSSEKKGQCRHSNVERGAARLRVGLDRTGHVVQGRLLHSLKHIAIEPHWPQCITMQHWCSAVAVQRS